MPEYDAFGREIGDDPLAALREATVAEPRAEPADEPRATPVPVVAEPAAFEPPVVARPRRRRRLVRAPFLVLGLLVAAVGIVANVAVDQIERIEGGLEDVVVEPEPDGLGPDSMLREQNLAAVLALMRSSWQGRPLTLRVTPSRVDARLVGPGGRRARVRFVRGQGLRTSPLPGRGGTGIPYSRIDPAVPERLVRDDGRRVRFVRFDRAGWRARFR